MSTIRTNTLLHSDGTTTTEPSIPALDQRMAKAWINFNGTGTVAIRDSYNVSSITDNGTGDYTANFATAMSNVNYSVVGSAAEDLTAGAVSGRHWGPARSALSTTSTRMNTLNFAYAYSDCELVTATILGGQA